MTLAGFVVLFTATVAQARFFLVALPLLAALLAAGVDAAVREAPRRDRHARGSSGPASRGGRRATRTSGPGSRRGRGSAGASRSTPRSQPAPRVVRAHARDRGAGPARRARPPRVDARLHVLPAAATTGSTRCSRSGASRRRWKAAPPPATSRGGSRGAGSPTCSWTSSACSARAARTRCRAHRGAAPALGARRRAGSRRAARAMGKRRALRGRRAIGSWRAGGTSARHGLPCVQGARPRPAVELLSPSPLCLARFAATAARHDDARSCPAPSRVYGNHGRKRSGHGRSATATPTVEPRGRDRPR